MQQKKETRRPFIEHWQVVKAMLVIYDVISIAAAYFIALLLRFDFHYSEFRTNIFLRTRSISHSTF